VVEDETALAAQLETALTQAGYAVDLATTGEEAIAAVEAERYALALLDIGLPGGDGLEVLRFLRRRRDVTPVILLTARDRPDQKVEGLDAGADDYVVKPFDLNELMARIRAQVRRGEQRTSDILTAKGVSVDIAARTVQLDGRVVAITAKEFKVLVALLRRVGAFVSKSELEDLLYEDSANVESNTIETAVYSLRRKLGSDLIVTARGLGYTIARDR